MLRHLLVKGGALAALIALALSSSAASATSARPSAPRVEPCSDQTAPSWSTFGGDLQNTRTPADVTTPAGPGVVALSPRWAYTTAGAGVGLGDLNGTPIVAGGCVYLNTAAGAVTAVDLATGDEVWSATVVLDPNKVAGLGGIFVSSPVVTGDTLVALVNQQDAPYAIAFDRRTGERRWRSKPLVAQTGFYTNATPVVFDGLVLAGYSPAEGDPEGRGGVAIINASSGTIIKRAWAVPDADFALGYAGGGIWTAPAVDPVGKYAYAGTGNPFSKKIEHPNTNAIVKIDLDRTRATFGTIVGSAKGNIEQYAPVFRDVVDPACETAGDDPNLQLVVGNSAPCLQLDLDFGSPPNLFTDDTGRLLIGDLQKSGVYHVADARTMEKVWSATVGGSCPACNAPATAWDGDGIYGVSTPGGAMFSLAADGSLRWLSPVADGVHYQSTTVANGVAYTIASSGELLAFDAATGAPLLRRPIGADLPPGAQPPVALSSSGIAVVGDTLLVAAGNAVVAYAAPTAPLG